MLHVRTWREHLHQRCRDFRDLMREVRRYDHLFTHRDKSVMRRIGTDGWVRVWRWFKREYRIYYPWDDANEPPPPNYRDPAAVVMRRVFTPSTFLPPERR